MKFRDVIKDGIYEMIDENDVVHIHCTEAEFWEMSAKLANNIQEAIDEIARREFSAGVAPSEGA